MAKKSRKRPVRPKDNAGCMSGLISMFDFRKGRFTQKLLSDKKRGSGRHEGTGYSRNKLLSNLEEKHENDIVTNEERRVNSGKASIKALMEEEMCAAQTSEKISSSKAEQIKAELGFGVTLEKNHNHSIKNCKTVADYHVNDLNASPSSVPCLSTCPNPSENSYFDVNLAELMVEFCNENLQCHEKHMDSIGESKHHCLNIPDPQLAQKHSILQKALGDLMEAILAQKSIDAKQITGNGAVYQSKEFMNALETLSSSKELFLKLLQDPDSFLLKHIQDLQNAQTGEFLHGSVREKSVSCNLFHKQYGHHFFRKKDKSKGEKPSNESSSSQAPSRIVVLKPSPARNQHHSNTTSQISSPKLHRNLQHHQDTERVSSHFSLKEIKRRLRNVIGESRKERITMDGILHKIPYGFRNSGENSKTSCSTEHTSQPSAILRRGDEKANPKEYQSKKKLNETTVTHPLYRESVFYEEARKHLDEMLSAGGENEILPTRQVSITLGRMLSLSGYNLSPRLSPGRDKETDSPQQLRFSPILQIKQENSTYKSPPKQSIESSPCTDSTPDDGLGALDSNPAVLNTQLQIGEDLIQKGSIETEECGHLDVPLEFCTNGSGFTSGRCKDEGFCRLSELGSSEEPQPVTPSVSVSPNSILVQKLEAPESIMENPDRQSPVSVLEPFFPEDINSPGRAAIQHAELEAEPRQLYFEEHDNSPVILTSTVSEANRRTCMEDKEAKLDYVRTVLKASGLSCNQFPERWLSSDQLLDPFLFDEVEISCGQLIDDSKLLFDCVNEVLVEIRERHLSCTPWVSFIKHNIRPIPIGGNFVQEVCKGIDRHLHSQFPCTLDQTVRKDLDGGTWMELQFETESAVVDIGEVMLDYLMEETILELWD